MSEGAHWLARLEPVAAERYRAVRPLRRIAVGARARPAHEQASFGALTSFATTIAISRTINYVRERRRRFPRLRSLTRQASGVAREGGIRVHHFIPGIAIAFTTGGSALFTHRLAFWLSLPYGSGVALTLDELGVLLKHNNPYWGSERFALGQAAVAATAAAGLAVRFHRLGALKQTG